MIYPRSFFSIAIGIRLGDAAHPRCNSSLLGYFFSETAWAGVCWSAYGKATTSRMISFKGVQGSGQCLVCGSIPLRYVFVPLLRLWLVSNVFASF